MPVKLNGATSGSVTIAAPAVAGTNTLTLPAATGTLIFGTQPSGTIVGTTDTQTLTNKTLTSPTVTGAVVSAMASSVLTSETAKASTSGTSIDFTNIPSWVKRITVMLNGVSTNGVSNLFMRVGHGATPTYVTSGYTYNSSDPGGSSQSTTGCILNGSTAVTAATLFSGQIVILVQDASSGSIVISSSTSNISRSISGTGRVTIPTAFVSAIRITTEGGTDTFDAGSINIMYE